LPNQVVLFTLARTAVELGDVALAPVLLDALAFAAGEEQHYELNPAGGQLAIYLTSLGWRGPFKVLDGFIKTFAESYEDEPWLMQARYARWYASGDSKAATAWLRDEAHKKGLGYVAAALADLDDKQARPLLEQMPP